MYIRISFIARYVYTYKVFVLVTKATAVQQDKSDRTKQTKNTIKRRIKNNKE